MKTLKTASLAVVLSFTGAANAGIPVADGLQLAQTIAMSMAEQALQEALSQASDQLKQKLAEQGFELDRELSKRAEDFAWEMYADTTEKYGYGWNFEIGNAEFYKHMETYTNEALKNKDSASFEETMANYKAGVNENYRKTNGLVSEEAHIQKVMDKDLNYKLMLDANLAETSNRHKAIEDLRAKANSAKTAQEKKDLEIAISIEQNAVINEGLRMQLASEAQALDAKTERYRLNKEVTDQFEKIEFSVK